MAAVLSVPAPVQIGRGAVRDGWRCVRPSIRPSEGAAMFTAAAAVRHTPAACYRSAASRGVTSLGQTSSADRVTSEHRSRRAAGQRSRKGRDLPECGPLFLDRTRRGPADGRICKPAAAPSRPPSQQSSDHRFVWDLRSEATRERNGLVPFATDRAEPKRWSSHWLLISSVTVQRCGCCLFRNRVTCWFHYQFLCNVLVSLRVSVCVTCWFHYEYPCV